VKQLAELHGGRVKVESKGEGHGAKFTIALPIRALRTESSPASLEPPTPLDHVSVLLVEDDADNRDVLRRLLERHHASVAAVGSALEALELLTTMKPQILVSDIGLPEIDGYELIRRVRQLDPASGGRIPAIALTARASSDD
jgi:CheY-like chemotaxis protein